MKKLMSLLLALAMMLSLVACGGSNAEPKDDGSAPVTSEPAQSTDDAEEPAEEADDAEAEEVEGTYVRTGDYDADCTAIYDANLGEFYDYYMVAKDCVELSERYALMAIAEAKLLEAAPFVPTTSQGGYYGLRRSAPYTVPGVKWGSDSDRFHNAVVCTELITAEDYQALKSLYAELRGTGTYEQAAKDYLVDHGYTLKDSYTFGYSSDPNTWDPFITYLAADSEAIVNTYDGLMEYDAEDIQQYALAESHEVSEDGLTYTFHLRQGVMWVDSQGREICEVTSDDFLAGMQHLLEGGSGSEYLAGASGAMIVNADEYTAGEVDFDQVGVTAPDPYTVVYTLAEPCPYFMTMLGYTTFAPLCRTYFLSQGGGFGADYDSTTCQYGIDPDHIAYCGPYLVTSATANNSIVFKANPAYWNADGINIKTLTWMYNDSSDPTKGYNDCINGVVDNTGLLEAAVEISKNDGTFDDYAIVSGTDATAFVAFYNVNRNAFANFNDATTGVTEQTEEQQNTAYMAMNNVHFRRALSFSLDRVNYNAQTTGADLGATSLMNSYTTGTMVSLLEDVTVDINGTATTFPAGTWYGEILQAQLDADGFPIKAWDPAADNGIGSSTGYDGWYNLDNAAAELAIAVDELAAEGIEITAENPVVLDFPCYAGSESYQNQGNAYKQSIEAATNGLVQVNLINFTDIYDWYYSQYFASAGNEMNFDIGALSGWSPDFGDPCSMLDTMLPDYMGYCTMSIGLF